MVLFYNTNFTIQILQYGLNNVQEPPMGDLNTRTLVPATTVLVVVVWVNRGVSPYPLIG